MICGENLEIHRREWACVKWDMVYNLSMDMVYNFCLGSP